MRIAIVYDSGYGHTARLAEAVARGVAEEPGAVAHLVAVADGAPDWAALEQSDAIIFGSPTYNGLLSARLKKFFEDSTKPAWSGRKWRDKIAAGFTNSGAQSGDKLNTLMSMTLFAAQHGMIWVGLDALPGDVDGDGIELNRQGSWLGAMAQSTNEGPDVTPPESDLRTAAYLGRRVARITRRFATPR